LELPREIAGLPEIRAHGSWLMASDKRGLLEKMVAGQTLSFSVMELRSSGLGLGVHRHGHGYG